MDLNNYIRDIKDFPKTGIMFKDIAPLLSDKDAFKYSIDKLSEFIEGVDVIVGLDARGFIFGGALSHKLGLPFVPVRKAGKLPYKTISVDYELEYGSNTFEMHIDAIQEGQKVAIIDDLLATGGTAKASIELVEKLGGVIHSVNFVINLSFLNGEEKLDGYSVNSLLKY